MKYVAKHGLPDRSRARVVVEKAYEAYKVKLADHKPALVWHTESEGELSFSVMSKTLSVQIHVSDLEVKIEGDMPWMFKPFQGKVERVLGDEIEKWAAKARAGEI